MRVLIVDASRVGRDRGALAQLIESADVDVACVHGAPHLLRWRTISAAIGRRSGLVVVTGGRPAGANLLLSTLGVDVVGSRTVAFDGATEVHPAGAALAVLRHRGSDLLAVSASLTGSGPRRLAQAHALTDAVREFGDLPAVVAVAGAPAGGTAVAALLTDGRTARTPSVFVDTRLEPSTARPLAGRDTGALVVEFGE